MSQLSPSTIGQIDRLFHKQDQAIAAMQRIAARHPAKLNHRRFKMWYRINAKIDRKLRHAPESLLVDRGFGPV